jgi:hypothetical protein
METNLLNATLPENFMDSANFSEKAIMPNGKYYEDWIKEKRIRAVKKQSNRLHSK